MLRKKLAWGLAAVLVVTAAVLGFFLVKEYQKDSSEQLPSEQGAASPRSQTTTVTTRVRPSSPPVTESSANSTSASSSPESTSAPSTGPVAPPSQQDISTKPEYLFNLGLPLGERWQIVQKVSDASRVVVIDTSSCGSLESWQGCPGFVVVNLHGSKNYLPYDNEEANVGPKSGPKCYWNQIIDSVYYSSPTKIVETVETSGITLRHSVQEQCKSTGSDVMHSWRSDKKGIVVYDFDLSTKEPVPGLKELVEAAVWK